MEYISQLPFKDVSHSPYPCTCRKNVLIGAHLPHLQAEANMTKYGKLLLAELPDDTTRLLQALCTDWVPKGQPARGGQSWGEGSGWFSQTHLLKP